jgi:Fuc2NAc and GlcNAc transferase
MSGPSQWVVAVIVVSALAASALLTQLMRAVAAGTGVLDVPNPRSSHGIPTPRGGGVAIVCVMTVAVLLLAARHEVPRQLAWALAAGGLAIALVGLADDHRSLSAVVRLAVHFSAALWALWCLGGLPPLRIGSHVLVSGWVGYVLGALGIVWAVNLFNFMDGVDGIAAGEAIFMALAAAALTLSGAGDPAVALVAFTFAAACGGFLLWNWPPARIFLGDGGSGYLGYVVVVLALAAGQDNPVALWVWLILGGVFFVDATVTLIRRLLRGERVYQAHRSHAYQWLARRWRSHARVSFAVLIVNLVWLLPWAVLATRRPQLAVAAVVLSFLPLAGLALALGSGRRERSAERA